MVDDTQAEETYDRLGVLPVLADADRSNPTHPLAAWLTAAVAVIEAGDSSPLADVITSDGTPWSHLLDPDTLDDTWLPWFAQFVGVLPNVERADSLRDRIAARENWDRGTRQHLLAVALRYLADGVDENDVMIYEREGGHAYRLGIDVYQQHLASPTYNELHAQYGSYYDLSATFPAYEDMGVGSEAIYEALLAAKPAGLVLRFAALVGGGTYAAIADAYGSDTYDDLAATFPTYDDLIDYLP